MIDIHSHILPGVDDGSPDLETSVLILRELASGGVTDVIATPHYVEETIYKSPSAANLRLLNELQRRLEAEEINVQIYLGNEIYITPRILELLGSHEISSLDDSKYLLVELPMSGEFSGYSDIFLKLIRAGYSVVLAHPERYTAFSDDFNLVRELFEMGVLMQCNVGSFAGQYGKSALKLVRKMAKSKMIFAMGSDIHHLRGNSFMPMALKKMSRFYDDAELEKILVENPKKIFEA